MTTIAAARTLIQTADLPPIAAFAADAVAGGMPALDAAKAQTLVVGADIVSFTIGVEAQFRQAIADSSLFAQLHTIKKIGVDADPIKFFDTYFSALLGLGWIVQKRETAEFKYKGDGFDVHEAVTGVITAFLAPIAGAAQAVLTVLQGLRKMDEKQPFIKLFDKQSRHGRIGRFQFTFVHNDPDHGLSAEIMAFALNAEDVVTQVLFFRLHKGRTTLRRSVGTLSADVHALDQIRPNLAATMTAYRAALIAEADLGPAPAGR